MSVSKNVTEIERLFMQIQETCSSQDSIDKIIPQLESLSPVFRSIAYESASFYFGYKDLISNGNLDAWETFKAKSDISHRFHIDIGLGWSVAKSDLLDLSQVPLKINPVFRSMIYDGAGYYYGLFKARNTIIRKQIPPGFMEIDIKAFDQGIGRRLWYLYHNDLTKLLQTIEGFPAERIPSIFRGLGIAYCYVSGFDEKLTESIKALSGKYWEEFRKGSVLGIISRSGIDFQLSETHQFTKENFDMTIDELSVDMKQKLSNAENNSNNEYWYDQISF